MTRILSLSALLMTLAACGSIDPLPGTYTFTSAVPTVDTCGFGEEADIDDESFVLAITDDDNVTVEVGDSDGIGFACSLDKAELICDDFVQTQDAGGDEADAVITVAWSFGGTFADESTLDPAELALNYTCAGADCAALAADADVEIPCQTAFDVTAAQ